MKKNLKKISGYFKVEKLRNDKRVIVFAVCLLIATVLWFLNALSKDYSATISYRVKYVSAPTNQFLSNEPPSKLDLKVDAHGFTLLRHKLNLSFSPIVLNLTTITNNLNQNSGGYMVNTSTLIRRISDQISNEISINSIEPTYLQIRLDSLLTKFVPVKPNFELTFKPQFNLREPVSVLPKQVKITGPAAELDTIYFLRTEKILFDKLDSDIKKSMEILYPENTSINPKKVSIQIPVEKFTEKELSVPIQIKNIPENVKIKLFPSKIKLTFLVGLSEFENITSANFQVFVDYETINSDNENLKVYIETKPSFIQIQRFSPENVEYLIETN
jgi:hypothetical protein